MTDVLKPYYEDELVTLYCGNAMQIMPLVNGLVVTDPPYNIGYHYASASDNLSNEDYNALLAATLRTPSVVVCYPEIHFRISGVLGINPSRCAAWVYAANTPRQFRMIGWYGVSGKPERVRQPYRNPKDKRIAERIARGEMARGYDWREIQQVKNVSAEKTKHPCQNPVEVMSWMIQATDGDVIVDPFAGSGTTLIAAKRLGRRAIGIEIDEEYCEVAANRLTGDYSQ
jgi:site-specific DNA-methyltransferase (adenine-specific)